MFPPVLYVVGKRDVVSPLVDADRDEECTLGRCGQALVDRDVDGRGGGSIVPEVDGHPRCRDPHDSIVGRNLEIGDRLVLDSGGNRVHVQNHRVALAVPPVCYHLCGGGDMLSQVQGAECPGGLGKHDIEIGDSIFLPSPGFCDGCRSVITGIGRGHHALGDVPRGHVVPVFVSPGRSDCSLFELHVISSFVPLL